METHTEKEKPANGQLIYVPPNDTVRLLEVYVKRSLSLNDGTLGLNSVNAREKEKWVPVRRRIRRHSSDPSFLNIEGCSETRDNVSVAELRIDEEEETPKKISKQSKKIKKPTFWKTFLGFFSRKTNEDKDEEHDVPAEKPEDPEATDAFLPSTPVTPRKKTLRKRSMRRRFSKRRLSLIKLNKPGKELHTTDITGVEGIVSVEPTNSYYENVSAELEKIVHEVKVEEKPLSNEELIERFIALTKEEGDAMDVKLKENPTLSSFFQKITYSSFKKLADAYLEKEVSIPKKTPTVPPTAPELVKLAFTLDFTARMAMLSKQNVVYITGLGNRYLQDQFEYTQACTDHPWSDSDD
ncbi:uncharacterized protein LOC114463653 [Gouania willdenowi]|uniref:uncharacterized protein LOC114463653 n=1 Tax=Gouania willdenowi TaxID=441366 RepID=UPI001056C104|nr:uncharacterized protein LOC114463653 [Gouania willdenowi]